MINQDIIIPGNISLLHSLEIMGQVDRKLLIVCDEENFKGVISIGDIQRALLKKEDLSLPVLHFVRKKVTFARVDEDIGLVKERMHEEKIEAMPVVDDAGKLCDIIEWKDLFTNGESASVGKVDLPVVIMAGGKGTRLLPLTNVIPKPLIPISDRTIIEEIMMRFKMAGCQKYYLSVNYLTDTIKNFFAEKPDWDIHFLQESKPLGTGGSLYLLKNQIKGSFFVTNCDTLIDIDLNDLLSYHRKNGNLITMVSAIKTVHIPYGTIETGVNGVIREIREKPDYVYQVNSGLYALEDAVLDYIENDQFMNITDLISRLISQKKKVGAFPVSEKAWVDMGNWEEYLKLVSRYNTDRK